MAPSAGELQSLQATVERLSASMARLDRLAERDPEWVLAQHQHLTREILDSLQRLLALLDRQ